MSGFTNEEIDGIFDLAYKIEGLIDGEDFSTVFNALLVALANGGRTVAHDVPEKMYMHMVVNNTITWRKFLDQTDADFEEERKELQEQFKRTDWYFDRAEGNAYYEGRESYEKTMLMVRSMGDQGVELMENYLAKNGIKR